jgi:PAS domain S-box-containing protein
MSMAHKENQMRVATTVELLESLPGPAWTVDCLLFRVVDCNSAAAALASDDEFLSLFEKSLNERLIGRLRGEELKINFHARLKGEERLWMFSAALLAGELANRLILAQPAAVFDVPTQITFDELADSAFDGIVVLNSERRIVQISQRFEQMFGYSIDELRGKTPQVLVPHGAAKEFFAGCDLLDRGGEYQIETKRRRRNGTLLEVQVSSQPIASGRFRGGLVVIYRDMTAANRDARFRNLRLESTRTLASAATLEEAAKELLPAIAKALDWDVARLWLLGANGMECFHSHAKLGCSCGDIGYPGSACAINVEAAGKGLAHREDHFQPVGLCATKPDCKLRDGAQAVIPIVNTQKQVMGVLEMLSSHRPQPETGRRELLEGMCAHLGQFITRVRAESALAESEAKFRTLAETTPTGIFIHCDGVIVYANAACETISGYSRDEIMGQPVWGLFQAEDIEEFRRRSARRLDGDQFEERYEARVVRKNGEIRWVDYSAARIMVENHPAVLCAAIDITEKRALETQLRQTQKMEAIGRLAGGIAHDFNNLLTVIGCCAESISMRLDLPEDVLRSTTDISYAADRAAALTKQLMLFSRHQLVAPKLIDLNAVLAGTELILRRSLGDDIVLRFNFQPGLGVILADGSQLEQVVMNLAVNARDAMPNGGELSISTESVTLDGSAPQGNNPGEYLLLKVMDNGSGMSQEIQQHIFEPFFTTKHSSKGTGLGLSTVYGIVKQCGGSIQVESQPGCGTTFKVFLPLAPGLAERKSCVPAPSEESLVATILLVEDEEDVREVLRAGLMRDGHKLLEASCAADALNISAAYEGTIDMMMTDVVMSGMSGRELADQLMPMRPGMKVLFVSGYNEDTVLQKGVIERQMEFLQKPFTRAVLSRKVREILLNR